MKRRNYLICSIIAMLSIVSYACETEYATCEGCGISIGDQNQNGNGNNGTSSDNSGNGQNSTENPGDASGSDHDNNNPGGGNGPSENVCNSNMQRCTEDLKGKQVCTDGKWENNKGCNYCFNENTSNEGVTEVGCGECTPNSYDESETEVCYKGAFIKVGSKELDGNDTIPGIVINTDPMSDDALWELAFNESATESGSFEYYSCHNAGVFGDMKINGNAWKVVDEKSCCEENDYYIKRTGYKYHSIEKCVKVELKNIPAGFMAYKYTGELNDLLIGQKQELPYGFCYNKNMFLAVSDDVVEEGESAYRGYQCGGRSECNSDYDGLCILDDVSIDDKATFMCDKDPNSTKKTAFVIKSEDGIIATCPIGTELRIKDDNGKWSNVDCAKWTFTLDKVRCAPIKSSNDRPTPIPKL